MRAGDGFASRLVFSWFIASFAHPAAPAGFYHRARGSAALLRHLPSRPIPRGPKSEVPCLSPCRGTKAKFPSQATGPGEAVVAVMSPTGHRSPFIWICPWEPSGILCGHVAAGSHRPSPAAFYHLPCWGGSDFKIQIPPIRAGCGLGSELGQGIGSFILCGAFLFLPCIFLGANWRFLGQTTARARGPAGVTHDVRHRHNAAAWLRAAPVPSWSLYPVLSTWDCAAIEGIVPPPGTASIQALQGRKVLAKRQRVLEHEQR